MQSAPVFKQPSNLIHDFSRAPRAEISRSQIDRSKSYISAFNAGDLIPFYWDEVLPGDTFNVKATIFARLATPIYPIFDNIYLDTQWFFCPNRLLWNNWKKFCGERDNPADSIDFVMPVQTKPVGGYATNSLGDYLGIPILIANMENVRADPFRMYNRTWNEWYRDENLQNSVTVDLGDGPDTASNYTILKRGKRHDYFTSCLPWPQKGTQVTLPLGSSAPVKLDLTSTAGARFVNASTHLPFTTGTSTVSYNNGANNAVLMNQSSVTGQIDPAGTLYTDLTAAAGATINDLIRSFAIQDLLVRDARGGTRYTEILQAHFGVTSPDASLQRVEYLGGSSQPMSFYAVPNTSDTATRKQGALAAYSEGLINNEGFTKSFTEHGIVMGIVSLRADLHYQQGLERKWSRSTRYDFYWPSLASLGEQAVLNKEIFLQGTAADQQVFGYQERWAEYRYNPSLITGIMRSDAAQPLDAWHLAQDFASLPTLNATFIQENPPIARIIATPSDPHIIFDSFIKVICARPMPLYSVPSLTNHL